MHQFHMFKKKNVQLLPFTLTEKLLYFIKMHFHHLSLIFLDSINIRYETIDLYQITL